MRLMSLTAVSEVPPQAKKSSSALVIFSTAYLLKWTYAGRCGFCWCESGWRDGLSADVSGVSGVVSR